MILTRDRLLINDACLTLVNQWAMWRSNEDSGVKVGRDSNDPTDDLRNEEWVSIDQGKAAGRTNTSRANGLSEQVQRFLPEARPAVVLGRFANSY